MGLLPLAGAGLRGELSAWTALLSPDQVLLVGHAGGARTQRNVAVLIPGEAVLGDAVVSVGEEAG